MAVAKKTISLKEDMYDQALRRAKRMGYESFSEYVAFLIKQDLAGRPAHIREEPPPDKP